MISPRSQLVDPEAPGFYHCISRCVRRVFLCGEDEQTGRSFAHRKQSVEHGSSRQATNTANVRLDGAFLSMRMTKAAQRPGLARSRSRAGLMSATRRQGQTRTAINQRRQPIDVLVTDDACLGSAFVPEPPSRTRTVPVPHPINRHPVTFGVPMRLFSAPLIFVLAIACQAHADNPELARLAAQDQADRAEKAGEWDDDARRRRVLELLATGAVSSPRDKLHAALILQHTPGQILSNPSA